MSFPTRMAETGIPSTAYPASVTRPSRGHSSWRISRTTGTDGNTSTLADSAPKPLARTVSAAEPNPVTSTTSAEGPSRRVTATTGCPDSQRVSLISWDHCVPGGNATGSTTVVSVASTTTCFTGRISDPGGRTPAGSPQVASAPAAKAQPNTAKTNLNGCDTPLLQRREPDCRSSAARASASWPRLWRDQSIAMPMSRSISTMPAAVGSVYASAASTSTTYPRSAKD